VLVVADPEGEFAGKDVDKFFARVGVGFFAAASGLNFDALGLQGTGTGDQVFDSDTAMVGNKAGALLGVQHGTLFALMKIVKARDSSAEGVGEFEEVAERDTGLTTFDGT